MGNPSKSIFLKVCGTLKDFLNLDNRSAELLQVPFKLHPSAKDLLEAQGIPHTSVFQIKINGQQDSIHCNLQDGDTVVIYPFEEVSPEHFESVFSSPSTFIADGHLGKLVKVLRLLGFDTQMPTGWSDAKIISRSNNQNRMILTRDLGLLQYKAARYGYWIRSIDPDEQIHEIFQRFRLAHRINPFTRCMECNGLLKEVTLQQVENDVPPKVKEWHDQFFRCECCQRVYWQGSHFKKLKEKVDDLTQQYS